MPHFNKNSVLQYVSGTLPDESLFDADIHISECRECREQVQTLTFLRNNFDQMWESWTAAQHGNVYRQYRVLKALRHGIENSPSLAKQALKWFSKLKNQAGINLKILFDRPKKITSIGASLLPNNYSFGFEPMVAGVGSPEKNSQFEEYRKKSSELISQGQTIEAEEVLVKAAAINARLTQGAISEIRCGEELRVKIYADTRRGNISVKYWPLDGNIHPSLAILIVNGDEDECLISEFKKITDEVFWVAQFSKVPSGTIEVFIEPED